MDEANQTIEKLVNLWFNAWDSNKDSDYYFENELIRQFPNLHFKLMDNRWYLMNRFKT